MMGNIFGLPKEVLEAPAFIHMEYPVGVPGTKVKRLLDSNLLLI